MKTYRFKAGYFQQEWLEPCFIRTDSEGDLIYFGSEDPKQEPAEIKDAYLLPGMLNAHSHSFQYAMAGMAEHVVAGNSQDDFWSWREKMYTLANTIEPKQLLELTTQFYMALLEEGYTGVCEFHYLHHDKNGKAYQNKAELSLMIMEAAERSGIHLTLVPVHYQQSAPGIPLKPQQRRFYSPDVDSYLDLLEEIKKVAQKSYKRHLVGYGVHSLRAAPLNDLKTILGRHWAPGPAHFHVSEQTEDARIFEQSYGKRAIDWLFDEIPLGPGHNLVHATHINDDELKKIVRSKANVVLCPTTESNLGDGIFPFPDYHRMGGAWCVGSDSHVNISPFVDMRSLELTHRLLEKRRNILCSDAVLDSGVTIFDRVEGSARQALGLNRDYLMLGEKFSGITLDAGHDRLIGRPLNAILSILVYTGDKSMMSEVYSGGRKVVEGGQHLDRMTHRAAFRKAMLEIQALI